MSGWPKPFSWNSLAKLLPLSSLLVTIPVCPTSHYPPYQWLARPCPTTFLVHYPPDLWLPRMWSCSNDGPLLLGQLQSGQFDCQGADYSCNADYCPTREQITLPITGQLANHIASDCRTWGENRNAKYCPTRVWIAEPVTVQPWGELHCQFLSNPGANSTANYCPTCG